MKLWFLPARCARCGHVAAQHAPHGYGSGCLWSRLRAVIHNDEEVPRILRYDTETCPCVLSADEVRLHA
jgi:hypothetical protein